MAELYDVFMRATGRGNCMEGVKFEFKLWIMDGWFNQKRFEGMLVDVRNGWVVELEKVYMDKLLYEENGLFSELEEV